MSRTAAPMAPAVRSDAEIEQLIRESRHLVASTVFHVVKAPRLQPFIDDFRSVALIAMWKAARIWDPETKIPWIGYVKMCMKNAIRDEIRTMTHRGRAPLPVYTADLAHESRDGGYTIEVEFPSTQPGPTADLDRDEDAMELVTAMAMLNDQQLDVLTRYFFEDETMATIGAALGVSESRVSQIVNEGKRNLRTHILALRSVD